VAVAGRLEQKIGKRQLYTKVQKYKNNTQSQNIQREQKYKPKNKHQKNIIR
jgi:hypothetical protein